MDPVFGGEMRGFAEHSSIVHDSVTLRRYDSAEHQILLTGPKFLSILRLARTRCSLVAHFGFRRKEKMSRRKEKMKRLLVLALTLLITPTVFAQSVSKQLQDMKDAISAQQQQIQQLQQQVQNRDQA